MSRENYQPICNHGRECCEFVSGIQTCGVCKQNWRWQSMPNAQNDSPGHADPSCGYNHYAIKQLGYRQGEKAAEDRIVAWLLKRGTGSGAVTGVIWSTRRKIADAINRGDHKVGLDK
jgi:hypothetical protein